MSYLKASKLDTNTWITDPEIADPENMPIPLGWCLMVRPYPVISDESKSSLILSHSSEQIDHMNYTTNIGRVVSLGPCCFSRPEHKIKGEQKDWVKVGDFVSYPKNVGAKRKFKNVSFVLLVDDEIVEKLPDPQVFDDDYFTLNIPDEHMTKYNTIKNPNYKKDEQ